MIVSSYYYIVI